MTEILLVLALLPVAAASGWYMARQHYSRRDRRDASVLSSKYFRGLNYLLNEQPDKAIEVFLGLAEVNQETVETHLALGNLFRRRGEVDKAIRFHKHIMSRPNLTEYHRTQALLELGEDYMRAGLLDRAEKLFAELVGHDRHSTSALRHLLSIYQQEKDWSRAIAQAQALRRVSGEDTSALIAQFHCELAAEALARDDVEGARREIRQARRYDPGCVRARLISGELAQSQEQWAEAAESFQAACELDPDFIVLVLENLVQCHARLNTHDRLLEWLSDQSKRTQATAPMLARAQLLAQDNPAEAMAGLLKQMRQRPTVRGLQYLVELMHDLGHGLDEIDPALIRELMQRLLDGQPRFRCQQCGFSGQTWHWQCPSCRQWETTRPVIGVLGE